MSINILPYRVSPYGLFFTNGNYYYFYARNAKLVYLTKDDKTKPSPWTMQSRDKGNTLEESAVTCISWKSICTWLEERREKQLKSDQNAELLEQVRQYIGAIEWFCPIRKSNRRMAAWLVLY